MLYNTSTLLFLYLFIKVFTVSSNRNKDIVNYRDLVTAMPNIVLQVKTDVKTTLQEVGASELSPELEALLEAQILEIAKPEHKIRHLVSK